MSYALPGQGVPYGAPSGRAYGNSAWNSQAARTARELGGALPEQPYNRWQGQYRAQQSQQLQQLQQSQQSDSERRYVDRVAQELPDHLKSVSNPAASQPGDAQYGYSDDLDDLDDHNERPPRQTLGIPPSQTTGPRRAPVPTSRIPRPSLDQYSIPPTAPPRAAQSSPTPAWPLQNDEVKKGSVKAARERAQANLGLPPGADNAGVPKPVQQPMLQPIQQPIQQPVPALQRPAQSVRQEPPATTEVNYGWPSQPPLQSPPGRPVQVQTVSSQAQDPWKGEEFLSPTSPDMSRPITQSSYTSESSMGSIPDFPVPQSQPPPLPPPPLLTQVPRRMPLGPPPSARRGPSSYYSQQSFVSPIQEEMERTPHPSYASSNVIPTGAPDYYYDEFSDEDDDDDDDDSPVDESEGKTSQASSHGSESALVRQASLGKKAKPSLVPVRENHTPSANTQRPNVSNGGLAVQGAAVGAFGASRGTSRDVTRENTPQPSILSPTALADPSSSETSLSSVEIRIPAAQAYDDRPETVDSMKIFGIPRSESPYKPAVSSPLSPASAAKLGRAKSPQDAQMAAIIGGLERGGAIDKNIASALKTPMAGFGDRLVGKKRPPRLNVDSVRDAEQRGSLTSLPDLIRRATRLAANLDRGKTASKLGMEWFLEDAKKEGYLADRKSTSGSLSDILASFPPPGLATPAGNSPMGQTGWPNYNRTKEGPLARSDLDERFVFEKPGDRSRRRCCGMPRWAFICLMVILVLLIAAAIAIPVGLLVIPRQSSNKEGASAAIAVCQRQFPCQNGGSTTLTSNGACSCLCANGFTGAQCTAASDSACTSMQVDGAKDGTVGSAIPRLIDAASSNFSIPLSSQRILAQFSSSNASCTIQNALVTLNGALNKRSMANMYIPLALDRNLLQPQDTISSPSSPQDVAHDRAIPAPLPTPTEPALQRRGTATNGGYAQTSNGVVFASSSTPSSAAATDTSSDTSTPSQSSKAPATGAQESGTNTEFFQDFSRVAVLFVLQETGSISDASDAQGRLSSWFGEIDPSDDEDPNTTARNMSLGASGWTIDLIDVKVTVKNGTAFGKGIPLPGS